MLSWTLMLPTVDVSPWPVIVCGELRVAGGCGIGAFGETVDVDEVVTGFGVIVIDQLVTVPALPATLSVT